MNQESVIPIPAEQVDEILRSISYIQVLQTVFTSPLRGMMLACGKRAWKRGLLVLILIGLAGACADALLKLPGRVAEWERVASFLGSELGDIAVTEDGIQREQAVPKSVRGHFRFGRIDILKDGEEISDSLLAVTGEDAMGIVVSEREVVFWQDVGKVLPYVDRNVVHLLLTRIRQMQKQGLIPEVLTPEFLRQAAPRACYIMAPGLIIFNGLSYAGLMFFYTLLICMIVSSVRRSFILFPGSSFVFAVHAVIPPYVIALVYSCCFPAFLTFENAFWLASLGFAVYAVWEARNGMRKCTGQFFIDKHE